MKTNRLVLGIFVGLFGLILSSCSSSPVITRVDTDTQIDLSGDWNDTDSQLTAQAMVQDALGLPWLVKFTAAERREPKIIVGTVVNQSQEHINTDTFIKELQRAITNSGQAQFVASANQRNEIRAERADQAANSAEAKRQGQEAAADFMLQGTVNTIFDKEGSREVKYYQVDLQMLNIETNVLVWQGEKKIKKYVAKQKYKA
ncbi:MAG: penicillin-binding protein activator LpoB [Elusimicrobiota bacterium]|jgi:uncharacterized protein (TIGR02722 family)|nr:penicillin-binding protein activator LpoB [Elusimicrobiota bacterium]